jgi:hypothetical protein
LDEVLQKGEEDKAQELLSIFESNIIDMNKVVSSSMNAQQKILDEKQQKRIPQLVFQKFHSSLRDLNEERTDIVGEMVEIQDTLTESIREVEKKLQLFVTDKEKNSSLFQICGITTPMKQKEISKLAKKRLTELKKKRIQLEKDVANKKIQLEENAVQLKELQLHKKVLLKELKNQMSANSGAGSAAVETPVPEEFEE